MAESRRCGVPACGRVSTIIIKGRCSRCYQKAYRDNRKAVLAESFVRIPTPVPEYVPPPIRVVTDPVCGDCETWPCVCAEEYFDIGLTHTNDLHLVGIADNDAQITDLSIYRYETRGPRHECHRDRAVQR